MTDTRDTSEEGYKAVINVTLHRIVPLPPPLLPLLAFRVTPRKEECNYSVIHIQKRDYVVSRPEVGGKRMARYSFKVQSTTLHLYTYAVYSVLSLFLSREQKGTNLNSDFTPGYERKRFLLTSPPME